MAVSADLQKQITQLEERLRLVPVDQVPPSVEVRETMRVWLSCMHYHAAVLRGLGDIIEHEAYVQVSTTNARLRGSAAMIDTGAGGIFAIESPFHWRGPVYISRSTS